MVTIRVVTSPRELRAFSRFPHLVHKHSPHWVDTGRFILETFLKGGDRFCKAAWIQAIRSFDSRGKPLAQALFVDAPGLDALQIAFFDMLPGTIAQEAAMAILTEAQTQAQKRAKPRIILGLNGHVSYGVGILASNFEGKISFDSLWTPQYYHDFFQGLRWNEAGLATYRGPLAPIELPRLHTKLSFRSMDMERFPEEIALMGELCNICLAQTPLYFSKDPQDMVSLVGGLKSFLGPDNVIFAMDGTKAVGFLFWHPDYNEMLTPGRFNPLLGIALAWFLRKSTITTMKLNAIGVLPEYQGLAATLGLLHHAQKATRGQFTHLETNFIWDANFKSRALAQGIGARPDRMYKVYSKEVV